MPAGAVVVVSMSRLVPAGSVAAGSWTEPERPAAGGIVTDCGCAEPDASGTVVAAASGAKVGTEGGAVGVAEPLTKGGVLLPPPPPQAASADSARMTGPKSNGPGRGNRTRKKGLRSVKNGAAVSTVPFCLPLAARAS